MSHRNRYTFANDKELSDIDLRKVVEYLTKRTGKVHRIIDHKDHDIVSETGTLYEHKADRRQHETNNVAFEAYKILKSGKRKQWLFSCDADYLIVTSRNFLRVYRWKGAMQDEVREKLDTKWKRYTKRGGDDNCMELRCIPDWRLRRFLEWEEPWDNEVPLHEILKERVNRQTT